MDQNKWLEIEYLALRQEILALSAAEQSTVKFYLPTAGAVFAVPYIIHMTNQALLWSICAGVAGLLLLAMVHTLHASVDGVRKIGMYIKEGIETRTQGGLRWENVVHNWDNRTSTAWYSETLAISAGAVIAYAAATIGAAMTFLTGKAVLAPISVAVIVACLAVPTLVRLGRAGHQRSGYSNDVRQFLAPQSDEPAA